MLALQPLHADLGGLIAIAFMIISFIGWLSNLANKDSQKPPVRRERKPQDRKIRDEIDAFLQEATGGKPSKRPTRVERDPDILDAADVEVVSTPTQQRPKPQRSQTQRRPLTSTPQRSLSGTTSSRRPPRQEVTQRLGQESSLGQTLSRHVQSHMAERVALQASRDVEPSVDDSVAAHMGNFSADLSGSVPTHPVASVTPAAGELLKMLRNPEGVRQALVLGEVLNPPLAMRRSDR